MVADAAASTLREASIAFLEADVNGDKSLTFEEFASLVRKQMKTTTTDDKVKSLFEACDADGNGSITMNEYFVWIMTLTNETNGLGLSNTFRKYDSSGNGRLDAAEFLMACEDVGFGDIGHDLFLELDSDESGQVSYDELMDTIRSGQGKVGHDCKRFLTALSFSNVHETEAYKLLEAESESWELNSTCSETLRCELLERIGVTGHRPSDLFRLMTRNSAVKLTAREFVNSMQRMGYKGPLPELHNVHRELDPDRSGHIAIGEFYSWINGHMARDKRTRLARLSSGRPTTDNFCLADIEWTAESLHVEIQMMLLRTELTPVDLLNAYDTGDGEFSFKEARSMMRRTRPVYIPWMQIPYRSPPSDSPQFLIMMKKIVHPSTEEDTDLWDDEIRPVVKETFKSISGTDNNINVVELSKWLNQGWKRRKKLLEDERRGTRTDFSKQATAAGAATGPSSSTAVPQTVPIVEPQETDSSTLPNDHATIRRVKRSAPTTVRQPPPKPAQRTLPPMKALARQILGIETKLHLQALCRIAETPAGHQALQKAQLGDAQRRYERSIDAHLEELHSRRAALRKATRGSFGGDLAGPQSR